MNTTFDQLDSLYEEEIDSSEELDGGIQQLLGAIEDLDYNQQQQVLELKQNQRQLKHHIVMYGEHTRTVLSEVLQLKEVLQLEQRDQALLMKDLQRQTETVEKKINQLEKNTLGKLVGWVLIGGLIGLLIGLALPWNLSNSSIDNFVKKVRLNPQKTSLGLPVEQGY